jgi:hypothetical protein
MSRPKGTQARNQELKESRGDNEAFECGVLRPAKIGAAWLAFRIVCFGCKLTQFVSAFKILNRSKMDLYPWHAPGCGGV